MYRVVLALKQFQFNYVNDTSVVRELRKLAQWRKTMITSAVLFQIYSQTVERDKLRKVCDLITQEMPDALYMGCSTNGNILNGEFSEYDIAVTCTVCEYPNTRMEIKQFELTPESEVSVTDKVIRYVNDNPWIKAVEMFVVIRGLSMTDLIISEMMFLFSAAVLLCLISATVRVYFQMIRISWTGALCSSSSAAMISISTIHI